MTHYQAEEAQLFGDITVLDDKRGFQGDGFVKVGTEVGSKLVFNIEVLEAGDYFVTSRYAYGEKCDGEWHSNPTIAVPKRGSMTILVNGVDCGKSVFDKTNINWESWFYNGNRLALNKGLNEMTFIVNDDDSGNVQIDYIGVQKMK